MVYKLIFLVKINFILVHATIQTKFIKDLDTNVQFPPILERKDRIPIGHLRPLGWQNRPEGSVEETYVNIEPVDFWNRYVIKEKAVVIRGLVNDANLINKWTDTYLDRTFSDLTVNVKNKKQKLKEENVKMSLKTFLHGYRSEDWYLHVTTPYEMQDELPIPYIINCGPYVTKSIDKFDEKISQLTESYLWMSAGETSSLLHSHSENNLHCVFDGRKDFIMIPIEGLKKKNAKDWKKMLNLQELYPKSGELVSKINVDMVNTYEYKTLNELVWYWSTLKQGDCIYIPNSYLHQVRSYGRSISVSINFALLKPFYLNNNSLIETKLFSTCVKNSPLFDMMQRTSKNFLFTYVHGHRHFVKHNIDYNDAKFYLIYLLKNNTELCFEKFDYFIGEINDAFKSNEESSLTTIDALILWRNLIINDKTCLNYNDILQLNDLNIKPLKQALNNFASIHHSKQFRNTHEL